MALSCQRGQEGEVRQRSPLSALTLQDQEDRDRLGYDSLRVQNPLCHQNQAIKVNQRMIKIRPTKSWLTTTSSSGTVEVLGVIEKTKPQKLAVSFRRRRKDLCLSRQNRWCETLHIWNKEYISLGKYTGWPFCDLDPRSWLWRWLTKICVSVR